MRALDEMPFDVLALRLGELIAHVRRQPGRVALAGPVGCDADVLGEKGGGEGLACTIGEGGRGVGRQPEVLGDLRGGTLLDLGEPQRLLPAGTQ